MSFALDAVMADLHPALPPEPPSTFGLTDDEACAEAQRLRASGWSRGEIRRALIVPDLSCLDVEEMADAE